MNAPTKSVDDNSTFCDEFSLPQLFSSLREQTNGQLESPKRTLDKYGRLVHGSHASPADAGQFIVSERSADDDRRRDVVTGSRSWEQSLSSGSRFCFHHVQVRNKILPILSYRTN